MNEKTEWEVVDAPAPDARQTVLQLMKNMLGPWWKWKIAGAVTVAGVALVLLAALTGVFMVVIVIAALASVGIGKFRQWLRRHNRSVSL